MWHMVSYIKREIQAKSIWKQDPAEYLECEWEVEKD